MAPSQANDGRGPSRPTMSASDDDRREGSWLARWSRRKNEAAHGVAAPKPEDGVHAQQPGTATAPVVPAPARENSTPEQDAAPLPAVESLSFDSDFTAFLRPDVDEALRRRALRKLFQDPRFNVMDGLDTYIDDYTKPDPIEPELVRQLAHARALFDPPRTRVNDQGFVEDIPREEPPESPSDASEALPSPGAAGKPSDPRAPPDERDPAGVQAPTVAPSGDGGGPSAR